MGGRVSQKDQRIRVPQRQRWRTSDAAVRIYSLPMASLPQLRLHSRVMLFFLQIDSKGCARRALAGTVLGRLSGTHALGKDLSLSHTFASFSYLCLFYALPNRLISRVSAMPMLHVPRLPKSICRIATLFGLSHPLSVPSMTELPRTYLANSSNADS